MRRFRAIILACAILLAMVLTGLWLARFRIARGIVARTLAASHVPASYRITRIGPFVERLEDVRIGDPARPDLVARRIDVTIGYALGGPTVTGVAVDGARLRAVLDGEGLHLGALDRLLPKAGSGANTLPDLDLDIVDGRLALATPNGAIDVRMSGTGNPAHRFRADATVEGADLRLAACRLRGVRAVLVVATEGGRPKVDGPIAIGATHCPNLSLGQGTMQVAATSDATFRHVALDAGLTGFAGSAGPAAFASLNGQVHAAGILGNLAVQAAVGLDHARLADFARAVERAAALPAGLPVTPTAGRAAAALARLLRDAAAEARIDAAIVGTDVAVRVRRASLAGGDGARIEAVERGGLLWSTAGWRADGDIRAGGGALPGVALALRQQAPGAPLAGSGRISAYRVGPASLAAPTLRFTWAGASTRFDARLLIDGPVGDGFVRGLDLPVAGRMNRAGLVVGEGCRTVAVQSLQLVGFSFGAARTDLCGRPIVAQGADGAVRIAATIGAIHLAGRSASGVPARFDTGAVRIDGAGFATGNVVARIGESHVEIAALDGKFGQRTEGSYRGVSGAIANVPLALSDGNGGWRFAGGVLALSGGLRVADAAPSPRFLPLIANDMRLDLKNGVVDAAASLHNPGSGALVVNAALAHDLAAGTGYATLEVPGIVFAPKQLQPEALTPLTLGVVANVAGTVSGQGRIAWSPERVTSSGSFGTERIDLAAAFGPASGIKGHIDFTDLLGLVSAPHQEATIAEINPGVAVANGVVHYQLLPGNRVRIEDASWPFAGGTLSLAPTTLDFAAETERHLTFRVDGLDAAAFVQQLDFPNIAATGRFDGVLPMIFDAQGGRIEGGTLVARREGGTLAYIGELSSADIGTMGKLAFDALKAIRYSSLAISFDGRLDGEMISQVSFTGVRQATPDPSLAARLIRNLPFRFNIRIRAPFRGLVGSARSYMDPRLLLNQSPATPAEPAIQPPASGPVR